jgi:hypothetical protein
VVLAFAGAKDRHVIEGGIVGSLQSEALCQGFDSYIYLATMPRMPNSLRGIVRIP